MPIASLKDRAVLNIDGADAAAFLQNLITTDIEAIAPETAMPGALLTPQGKILFDFLVSRSTGGFRLEMHHDLAADLVRRLTLYRLRSKIGFDLTDPAEMLVAWGDRPAGDGWLADLRFGEVAVWRRPATQADGPVDADEDDWHRLRIRHGVGESGADFAVGDAFPHDVLYDQNGGVGFRKGCFVGQEVVSRMQHRGTARRRLLTVQAGQDLPASDTELTAAGKPIGRLGSVVGTSGLAMVRIDRAASAMAAGEPILAGEVEVTLAIPAWAKFGFPGVDEKQA